MAMNHEHAAGIIRRVMADNPSLWYAPHALERMKERGISRSDVRKVLSRCWVSRIEPDRLGFRWTAEAKGLDERPLQIVIGAITADDEPVKVITVIAL